MKRFKKSKTPLSSLWQIRLFGRDWLFGCIKMAEAIDIAEESGVDSLGSIFEKEELFCEICNKPIDKEQYERLGIHEDCK
jgi:hypothetical protein